MRQAPAAPVEALQDFVDQGDRFTREEAQDAVDECKAAVEGCRDTWEERMGNMDQANLGGSPAFETLQERYDGAESLVQALEAVYIEDEPDGPDDDPDMTEDDHQMMDDEWEQGVRDAIEGVLQEDSL